MKFYKVRGLIRSQPALDHFIDWEGQNFPRPALRRGIGKVNLLSGRG